MESEKKTENIVAEERNLQGIRHEKAEQNNSHTLLLLAVVTYLYRDEIVRDIVRAHAGALAGACTASDQAILENRINS